MLTAGAVATPGQAEGDGPQQPSAAPEGMGSEHTPLPYNGAKVLLKLFACRGHSQIQQPSACSTYVTVDSQFKHDF